MNETIKKDWKKLTVGILSVLGALIATLITCLSAESCGSPKSLVKISNRADGTQTTISSSVGNGGNVSVSVTPDVTLSINPNK